jgi:alpha-mannosidase
VETDINKIIPITKETALAEKLIQENRTITMVGTTHFDPVWLWTWDEAMASIRSTFRSALDRMREEPRFIYSFSCPPVFEWVRQIDPLLFEEIRERVREGRWHLVEGWWIQPDCCVTSGESYARQGLHGQRYLKAVFGMQSRTGFNTDSFGHGAMLPQILKKSGIDGYVFGRPSPAEKELPGPLFRWESPDGSAILAFRCGGDGANQYSKTLDKDARAALPAMERLGHDFLMLYGVSNHGGAPTRISIGQINSLIGDASKGFDVEYGTPESFFQRQNAQNLPAVRDELLVKKFGVFSNHSGIKADNRRAEYALLGAERVALLLELLEGVQVPRERLTEVWKDLLFNQFHDIIGGASIRAAYRDARNLHGRALQTAAEILHFAIQRVTRSIDTSGEGFPLVVWNLNAFDAEAVLEAELQWAWEFDWYKGPLSVTDSSGTVVPCQVIQEQSVLPGFRSRLAFRALVPSLGYRTFHVHKREQPLMPNAATVADDFTMENAYFRVEVDRATGGLATVFDKCRGKELLRGAAQPVVREDTGDTWCFNVGTYGPELEAFRLESSRLVENGPVRARIRTRSRFRDSVLEQDFILCAGEGGIEGSLRIDWRGRHMALKLRFDAVMERPVLTSSIPYGSILRAADGVERPCGEWLDMSEDGTGMSLVSDSFFAYDMKDSRLDITVLRSPIYGHLTIKDPIAADADYDYMDQGVREGRWRLILHDGDWVARGVPQEAALFNNPFLVVDEMSHPGDRPQDASFFSVEAPTCLVTVLKKAEDGGDIVLRLVEFAGKRCRARFRLTPLGRSFETECAPYEIRTLRLGLGTNGEMRLVNILEEPMSGDVV